MPDQNTRDDASPEMRQAVLNLLIGDNAGNRQLMLFSFAISLIGTLLTYLIVGMPPLIGIDDAAITRNYSENLAAGHGFVYYVGGERVEGSTTFLWTIILAGIYAATRYVEIPILLTTLALTTVTIFAVMSIIRQQAEAHQLDAAMAISIGAVLLCAMPAFFFWSVFSMMETALWNCVYAVLVWRLTRNPASPEDFDLWLVAAAGLLPLIRPEGIAFGIGLLALALFLSRRLAADIIAGIGLALTSFALLTAFRLWYFGHPFPNTYYAKVSSDRLQSLSSGLKYLFDFAREFPFANVLLIVAVLGAAWAVYQVFVKRSEKLRPLIVIAAAIFGLLLTYPVLGDDHFPYWRLYHPILPLLVIIPALTAATIWPPLQQHFRLPSSIYKVGFGLLAAVWIGHAIADYYPARFKMRTGFRLVEQGFAFGKIMNDLAPDTTIGVGPAGGISLSYRGPIRDLFGLNWVEMAHAQPIKEGLAGHASFDRATFWKHKPDMVAEFNRPCHRNKWSWAFRITKQVVFSGLFIEPRFQAEYRPVRITDGDKCWRAFAHTDWLARHNDPRISVARWSDLTFQ